MKIEKLFKKIENFFNMDKVERKQNNSKKDKLKLSLEKKIFSVKAKIKETSKKEKKENLKKELKVLKKLRSKIKDKN